MATEYAARFALSERDAKLVGETIESILQERKPITSEELQDELVRRARPTKSPLHHLFEWDPAKQAELYLRERARQIIMHVDVVFEERPETPTRAFRVVCVNGHRGPVSVASAVKERNVDLLEALVSQAQSEAKAWAKRFEHLRDVASLAPVFRAVEKMRIPQPLKAKSRKKQAARAA